jgi:hypothetical protein
VRPTKVGTTSCVVTFILLGVALAFAAWRMPRTQPLAPGPVGSARVAESEAYADECASCHPAPGVFAKVLEPGSGWKPVAELLLTGEARFPAPGDPRVVRRHPTFETLTDERLAAILGHVVAQGSISPGDVAAWRTSRGLSPPK